MKSLQRTLKESLRLSIDDKPCEYYPKDKNELIDIINRLSEECLQEDDLKEGYLDLSIIDVSNITSFGDYFGQNGIFNKVRCSKIISIDVTGWDTSNVKDMRKIFSYFNNLKEIKGIEYWDVSKVINMENMFWGCESLQKIDLNKWRVDSKCNTLNMFYGCQPNIIPKWYKV